MEDKKTILIVLGLFTTVAILFSLAGYRVGFRQADMSTQYITIDSNKYIMHVDRNQIIKVIGIVNKVDTSPVY